MTNMVFYYSPKEIDEINTTPICYEIDEIPSLNMSIIYSKRMKQNTGISPRGYCIIEDGEIIKRVFFNAKIVKNNIQKDLDIDKYVISSDEEFCIPYDKDTDSIFSITI